MTLKGVFVDSLRVSQYYRRTTLDIINENDYLFVLIYKCKIVCERYINKLWLSLRDTAGRWVFVLASEFQYHAIVDLMVC